MPVYRVDRRTLAFPPPEAAEPDGLLAVGGDLRPERLLAAYSAGIFPWFSHRGTPYWFSPDPRTVFEVAEFAPSRRLARTIRSGRFTTTFDSAFDEVMRACATTPRAHEDGTWITPDFLAGYGALHRLGYAHSAEARLDGRLVGGVYGVAIGAVFCGESMFHAETDASKVAFAALMARLKERGFVLLDGQAQNDHLTSLGATEISRAEYLRRLRDAARAPIPPGRWT